MPSHDEIEKDIERLKQAQLAALYSGDYERAEILIQAVEELREWREDEMPGGPPVDGTSLLGESGPPQAAVSSQPEVPPPAPGKEVGGETDPPAAPEARPAEREESNNVDRQQRDREKVLAVDPENRDAQEALSRLEQRKRQEEWRSQILRLRAVLGESSKQISQVEEARLKASNLRDSGQISDSKIREELEDVFRQLDALRDDMLRAGEGGTSAERDGDFEKAMAVFRTALLNGYAEIVDDVSGERINTQESLTRVLQTYRKDLLGRVGGRYGDAEKSLEDGYPETAVDLLNECTDLLEMVYQGGEEVRGQVGELMGRAKNAIRDKDKAHPPG